MQCRTEKFSLGQLWLLRKDKKINASPPYQRGDDVWNRKQKKLFLDSIFNSYDTGKIYFDDLAVGKKEYAVIDGKQRLQALWDFFDSVNYHSLSDWEREDFKAKTLDIVLVEGASESELGNMFCSLNTSSAL